MGMEMEMEMEMWMLFYDVNYGFTFKLIFH